MGIGRILNELRRHWNIEKQVRKERRCMNNGIFGDPQRPIRLDVVNVHYWQEPDGKENLGDYLSWIVCEYMRKKFDLPECIRTKSPRHLYAIGSILGFSCQDATVWGSGMLNPNRVKQRRIQLSKLDVRCVRGPLTREKLMEWGKECPEIYGDPAVLMPRIYMPECTEKKYPVSLILHHSEVPLLETTGVHILPITTNDYKAFIDQLVQSEKVVSSSLHGIILAESYGVPAVYLSGNQKPFKYQDYYYGTGRWDVIMAKNLKEALEVKPMPLPNLEKMQEALIETFPLDLWK